MTKYKIVLVPFPFDDFSITKVRPAICLTNPIGEYDHIVIAFISSKIPETLLESDLLLDKFNEGFAETGLSVSSVVRLHKMVTIPKSLIKRQLGELSKNSQKELKQKLSALFEK